MLGLCAGGCCTAGCTATVTFAVTGCGLNPLPGATVTLTGVGTGTTNPSGVITFTGVAPGTYGWSVSKARFAVAITDAIQGPVVVPNTCANQSVPVDLGTLNVATGYRCCPHCPDPVPNDLHTTLNGSAVTLTNSGGGGWIGSTSFTTSSSCPGGSPATATATLELFCPVAVGAPWTVQGFVNTVGVPNPPAVGGCTEYYLDTVGAGCPPGGTSGARGFNADCAGDCSVPLSLSATAPSPWGSSLPCLTGDTATPFSGAVTITE